MIENDPGGPGKAYPDTSSSDERKERANDPAEVPLKLCELVGGPDIVLQQWSGSRKVQVEVSWKSTSIK